MPSEGPIAIGENVVILEDDEVVGVGVVYDEPDEKEGRRVVKYIEPPRGIWYVAEDALRALRFPERSSPEYPLLELARRGVGWER